ncbi:FkbM family methyltransferase [Alphaproteobacteria bacterium]|nr:FkbM family methyltransferase [Alphaproteobacteria bacterium]
MQKIKQMIKKSINRFGYDLVPFTYRTHALPRQKKIMESYNIDLVLDVGANIGNYGHKLLTKMGFKGTIISFEPMKKEFNILSDRCSSYYNWSAENIAFGDFNGTSSINISANSVSSSLLEILPDHTDSAPLSKFIEVEEIRVVRLDKFLTEKKIQSSNILLKLDVQGFEMEVINGAQKYFKNIKMLHIELSLDELYKKGAMFEDIYSLLRTSGFKLVGVEPGFSRVTNGELLQFDGLFVRCE